jgi:hypothetical protein
MDNTGQKALTMKTIKKIFGVVACVGILAASATSVFGQSSDTLANLAGTPGAILTIGDKTFSDFSYTESGLTGFDPTAFSVVATEDGGGYYLTWSGNVVLFSESLATANLSLEYIVTASAGTINSIDLSYTGDALGGGSFTVDETADTGSFDGTGGTLVGSINLGDIVDTGNFPIRPSQSVLYVTKDFSLSTSSDGGYDTISQFGQSFQQVPEPGTMLLGSLGGGLLLFLRSRRQARRD